MINVVLMTNAEIMRHGITKLLSDDAEIRLVATARNLTELKSFTRKFPSCVVIADTQSVKEFSSSTNLKVLDDELRLIANHIAGYLVMMDVTNKGRFEYAMRLGVRGFCLRSISGANLVKAVKCVAEGETYIQEEYAELVSANSSPLFDSLSERQLEIMHLILQGYSNHEISGLLHLSPETVKTHVRMVLRKLEARDRTQAILLVLQEVVRAYGSEVIDTLPMPLRKVISAETI